MWNNWNGLLTFLISDKDYIAFQTATFLWCQWIRWTQSMFFLASKLLIFRKKRRSCLFMVLGTTDHYKNEWGLSQREVNGDISIDNLSNSKSLPDNGGVLRLETFFIRSSITFSHFEIIILIIIKMFQRRFYILRHSPEIPWFIHAMLRKGSQWKDADKSDGNRILVFLSFFSFAACWEIKGREEVCGFCFSLWRFLFIVGNFWSPKVLIDANPPGRQRR